MWRPLTLTEFATLHSNFHGTPNFLGAEFAMAAISAQQDECVGNSYKQLVSMSKVMGIKSTKLLQETDCVLTVSGKSKLPDSTTSVRIVKHRLTSDICKLTKAPLILLTEIGDQNV